MQILQMTGLSGAGKTTLALALKQSLEQCGIAAAVIDGDEYRKTLCKDLGFSAADRRENIRRLAQIAHSYAEKGTVSVIAAINPFEDVRNELRDRFGAKTIWIHCDLEELRRRDTKGLYEKALLPDEDARKVRNLTGVNDPYEAPLSADLVLDTGATDVEATRRQLFQYVLTLLKEQGR